MLDIMFDVPSRPEIAEIIITAETITEGKEPKIRTSAEKKAG